MNDKQPRFDGLGLVMIGLVALTVIGWAIAGQFRPVPVHEGDTGTQIWMAEANWLMAWVSVAAAGIGAVTLLLLRLTWLEARQTRLETIRIGEAQTRAYVVVLSAVITESYPPGYWDISFQFRNSGQTPAVLIRTEISVWYEIAVPGGWKRIPSVVEYEKRPRSDLASQTTTTAEMRIYTQELRRAQNGTRIGAIRADFVVTYRDVFRASQITMARYRASFTPFNDPRPEGEAMLPIAPDET